MLNKVILTGRLTKTIELKQTPTGKSVAHFHLAVGRNIKNKAGEKVTDFLDCVIWGKLAETLSTWTDKGSLIAITGRLEKRSYGDKYRQRILVTEVLVEEFTLLECKKTSASHAQMENTDELEPVLAEQSQGAMTTIIDK